MFSFPRALSFSLVLASAAWLAACSSSHYEPPQMQGPPAMVDDGGKPRLWILTKQEEVKQVSVGGGTRSASRWRSDTFIHFGVQAYDPLETKPLWKKRLLTFGDPDAHGSEPSRVIGSAESAYLLGQDGQVVWLMIGDAPFGVSAADGSVVADSEALQRINPELKGLLPSEARRYGFDRGLVLMTADARMFVVRGPEQKATAYTPPPPVQEVAPLKANGMPEIVPMRPVIGEPPTRQATFQDQWLGLYTEKEAADLANDEWGRKFRYPYSVTDEGALARRVFYRGKIVDAQHFEDRFKKVTELQPVAGSPVFLKGRFMNEAGKEMAFLAEDGKGIFVWHSTRVDDAGRLALTRFDGELKPVWETELPLSESSTLNRISTWPVSGHIVVMGVLQSEKDGVTSREPQLVSIDLASGAMKSTKLAE
ncbi:PA2928 family protein [Arenimonas sp.]|uniref:PA2928 family protein n=1 Tax=Arenimonas sp. TaxID=1872635 RepID=UPI0039E55F4A